MDASQVVSQETSAPASTPDTNNAAPAPTEATQPAAITSLIDEALSENAESPEVKEPGSDEESQKSEVKEPDTKKDEGAKTAAPEAYEEFKLPEGIQIPENSATEFKTLAKELNLSQEQAQKLVDLQSNFAKTHQTQAVEHYKQQVQEWKKEAIEALGSNYKQELGFVSKAVRQFGGDNFKQILDDTGLGNHKDVLMFLNKVGKSISEDKFSEGKAKSAPRSGADILYPSSS